MTDRALTEADAERIAKSAAKQAIEEVLTRLGISVDDPTEMQKDFAFMRGVREATNSIKDQTIRAAIWTIIVGMLGTFSYVFLGQAKH